MRFNPLPTDSKLLAKVTERTALSSGDVRFALGVWTEDESGVRRTDGDAVMVRGGVCGHRRTTDMTIGRFLHYAERSRADITSCGAGTSFLTGTKNAAFVLIALRWR